MNKPDPIKEFLESVVSHIRWKKAIPVVSDELHAHIEDQRNAFAADGITEPEATCRAVSEMGDPVVVGTMLDHSYRPKMEWRVLLPALLLLIIGRLYYLASYPVENFTRFALTQLLVIAVQMVCLILVYALDFTLYAKFPKLIFGAVVLLFFLTPYPSPPYALHLLPVACAALQYSMRGKGYLAIVLCGLAGIALPLFFFLGGFAFPLSYRVELTDVLVCLVSTIAALTVCILSGVFSVKKKNALLLVYIPATVAFILLILCYSRIFSHHLEKESMQSVYQMLSGSRLLGAGDPAVVLHTDVLRTQEFIFTRLIYQFGWLPFAGIVGLLTCLFVFALRICMAQRSMLGKVIGCAALSVLAVQSVIYLLANLGIPFYAPSSAWYAYMPFLRPMLTDAILVGVLLSVCRTGDITRDCDVKVVA